MARLIGLLVLLLILAGGYVIGSDYVRRHPQDVPWTDLDLKDPVGAFTGRKIASLGDDPNLCRALLRQAGAEDVAVPARLSPPSCGYSNGMRLAGGPVRYAPSGLVTACPVAAALHLFDTRVVQFAALRHFNSRVVSIEHFGSYSCRRLYGRSEGEFSEHATANAVDIAGFVLADGTRIRVISDWPGDGPKADFLREVRDGACDLFATVLSPDYNAAHRDHLHLDQAKRGEMGFRVCR